MVIQLNQPAWTAGLPALGQGLGDALTQAADIRDKRQERVRKGAGLAATLENMPEELKRGINTQDIITGLNEGRYDPDSVQTLLQNVLRQPREKEKSETTNQGLANFLRNVDDTFLPGINREQLIQGLDEGTISANEVMPVIKEVGKASIGVEKEKIRGENTVNRVTSTTQGNIERDQKKFEREQQVREEKYKKQQDELQQARLSAANLIENSNPELWQGWNTEEITQGLLDGTMAPGPVLSTIQAVMNRGPGKKKADGTESIVEKYQQGIDVAKALGTPEDELNKFATQYAAADSAQNRNNVWKAQMSANERRGLLPYQQSMQTADDVQGAVNDDDFEYPPSQALQNQTEEEKVRTSRQLRTINQKPILKLDENLKNFKEQREKVGTLEEINTRGNLPEGWTKVFYVNPTTGEPWIKGTAHPDVELWQKTLATFIRYAKTLFPGRITNFDLQKFMEQYPDLMNSEEGRRVIINEMKNVMDQNIMSNTAEMQTWGHYGQGGADQVQVSQVRDQKLAGNEEYQKLKEDYKNILRNTDIQNRISRIRKGEERAKPGYFYAYDPDSNSLAVFENKHKKRVKDSGAQIVEYDRKYQSPKREAPEK